MEDFKIAIVERGSEALWRNYWIRGSSEGTADEAPSGLGRTQIVHATSVDEAIGIVQRQHPDCTVMIAGRQHHVN